MKVVSAVLVVGLLLLLASIVAWRREERQFDEWRAWCHGEYVARGVTGVSEEAWCNPRDF